MTTVERPDALVTAATTTSHHHNYPASTIGKPPFEFSAEPTAEAASPAPILITEQEVVFGTAVAVRARPTTTRRWRDATAVFHAVMQRMLLPSTADGARPCRDYPRRYAFLEYSCMAREMDRL